MYVYCRDVSVVLLWFLQGPIHSIADLEPLCGMCQESVCSVTLKPCDHMMCSGLLSVLSSSSGWSLLKACFVWEEGVKTVQKIFDVHSPSQYCQARSTCRLIQSTVKGMEA